MLHRRNLASDFPFIHQARLRGAKTDAAQLWTAILAPLRVAQPTLQKEPRGCKYPIFKAFGPQHQEGYSLGPEALNVGYLDSLGKLQKLPACSTGIYRPRAVVWVAVEEVNVSYHSMDIW